MLRKKKEKREVKMVSEEAYALPGEASLAPLKNTAKQQGGQVKQGMLQCQSSPKVDGHPARRILYCKCHIRCTSLQKEEKNLGH
jgi:hypothetical protein